MLALSQLRAALGPGWTPAVRWHPRADVGGVLAAALETPPGTSVAWWLEGAGGVAFETRVGLDLLSWSEAATGARFAVTAERPTGEVLARWTASAKPYDARKPWRWRRLAGRLPETGGTLVLRLASDGDAPGLWAEPALDVADAAPAPAPAPPAAPAGHGPVVSLLVPVHDPVPEYLEATVASVLAQGYESWELCLVDDGSSDPWVHAALRRWAAGDPRVRVARHEAARGISAASNTALSLASGSFVALLDHDDVLVEGALAAVAAELAAAPDTDYLYSDEDLMLEDGSRLLAYRKPGWSPDFLRSLMYTCHLSVYRRTLVESLGGFRREFDGSQDYDLALRVTERTNRVRHLPRVLYRWRVHERSASANTDAKPYAYHAARKALAEHLERRGIAGRVDFGAHPGEYRARRAVPRAAGVAVVARVGTARDPRALAACARALSHTTHDSWELTLIGDERVLSAALPSLWSGGLPPSRVHLAPGGSWAEGVAVTATSYLLLLEELAEPLHGDWLGRLLEVAVDDGVGAVGGRVLSPDGRVEHGPAAVLTGVPVPVLHGEPADEPGHLGAGRVVANASALTGAVLTRRETFDRLGGLRDPLPVALPDYTLRVRDAGWRVASVPEAALRRPPGRPVANDVRALAAFRRRWAASGADPFYNPAFWTGRADYTLVDERP